VVCLLFLILQGFFSNLTSGQTVAETVDDMSKVRYFYDPFRIMVKTALKGFYILKKKDVEFQNLVNG
jgi:hypothetical protein